MYANGWTISAALFALYIIGYCVRREYFVGDRENFRQSQLPEGYSTDEIIKAYEAIELNFENKGKITKTTSAKKENGILKMQVMIYFPETNKTEAHEAHIVNGKIRMKKLKREPGGYTITEVNAAIEGLKDHFVEKENTHIHITKILSIEKSNGNLKLKLFAYNLDKNVIGGYIVTSSIALKSGGKSKAVNVKRFTDEQEKMDYKDTNLHQPIDFKNGMFDLKK